MLAQAKLLVYNSHMADRPKQKSCLFCDQKKQPSYTDIVTLRKVVSDRGRIVSRLRSGLCAKHQRRVTSEIKRARHLALLPFTIKL